VHRTPHGLRHSTITIGLDAGVSLRDLQDFSRHADPKTTRRYDRSRHALNRHATYIIARYLGLPQGLGIVHRGVDAAIAAAANRQVQHAGSQ
jgi:integrase